MRKSSACRSIWWCTRARGEVTEALVAGKLDLGFMPVDDERKKVVDFAPNYALGESTYMVAPGSKIKTIAEVDQAGVRVLGVENTTTIRAVRRLLKHATVMGSKGSSEIPDLVRSGQVDAVALGRDSARGFRRRNTGRARVGRSFLGSRHRTGRAEEQAVRARLRDRMDRAGKGRRQRAARV